MFLMEWIGENGHKIEASEERMETLYNLGPGDIRSRVENAVWMLYSMRELSRLFGSGKAKMIDKVSIRVEKGIREELIPLVSLKGIGRVRARRLFSSGLSTLDLIRRASLDRIASVEGIGKQIALQLKSELNPDGEIIEEDGEPGEIDGPKQSLLFDFT
jgi:helicase